MYMCIYIYVYIYICVYACMYICMHACMHVCMSACLHVCMSACLSACLPVCLSACLPACLSLPGWLAGWLSVCLSLSVCLCLAGWLSVCLSLSLSACLPAWLAGCLSVCMSACLRVCVYVCLSVCLSVCMHACMYVCMCVHACMHACMHACIYLSIYLCMYVCMYVCRYVRMYVCMCVCVYCVDIIIYIYVCMYVSLSAVCRKCTKISVTCCLEHGPAQLQSSSGSSVPHWRGGKLLSAPWRLRGKTLSTGSTPTAQRHIGRGQACDHPWPHRSSTGTPAAPWSTASTRASRISHEVWNGSKTASQGVRQPKCGKIPLNTGCCGESSVAHDWRLAARGPGTYLHQHPAYQENQGHSPPSPASDQTCQWKQANAGHTRICAGHCLRGCWRQTPRGTCCMKGVASDGQSQWFRLRPVCNLLQGSTQEF